MQKDELVQNIIVALTKGTQGPMEAMEVIEKVIGIMALSAADDKFPKESSIIFQYGDQTYRVITRVEKLLIEKVSRGRH